MRDCARVGETRSSKLQLSQKTSMLGHSAAQTKLDPLCYVAFQEFRSENPKREEADVKSAYKMFQGQAGGKPSINAVDQDRWLKFRHARASS